MTNPQQINKTEGEVIYQSTVDSVTTADLETGAAVGTSSTKPPRHVRRRIQAIQWPPRSPIQIVKNGIQYVKSVYKPLEIALLGAFVLLCFNIPFWMLEQHRRPIPIQTTAAGDVIFDFRFNQSNKQETFPGPLADKLTVYVPLAFYWLVGNLFGTTNDAHAAFCMYLLSIGMKIFVVEAVKRYTGYWRPNFFDATCNFNATTLDCGPEGAYDHGYTSFPSGHAATAMTSGTIWTLYIMAKVVGLSRQLQKPARRQYATSRDHWAPALWVKALLIVACIPFLLGIFIATSRMTDDWHHPADVLAGIELGVGTAVLAHAIYYPSVFGDTAGIPRMALAEEEEEVQEQPIEDNNQGQEEE